MEPKLNPAIISPTVSMDIFNMLPCHRKIAEYIDPQRNISDFPNVLLYGHRSFPLQIVLYHAFHPSGTFKRVQCVYNKDIVYHTTPYFIEIDFENPSLPRDLDGIPAFLKTIITQNAISGQRNVIILRNVDAIEQKPFCNILEDFSKNVWFLCTTHRLNNVSDAIRSRVIHLRVPAAPKFFPTKNAEIAEIFKMTGTPRAIAYKLLQTAASFSEIAAEYVAQRARPTESFIREVAELEHKFACTRGARIPIFIERLLYIGSKN